MSLNNNRRLILVAGPAASGKTFLINKIQQGGCPRLCHQLGIADPGAWQFVSMKDLYAGRCSEFDNLIVHCDLYNAGILDRIEKTLLTSDQIDALTLSVSPATLVIRNRKRLRKILFIGFRNPNDLKKNLKKVMSLYRRQKRNKDKASVVAIYEDWFGLLNKYKTRNYWMESSSLVDDPIVHSCDVDCNAALQYCRDIALSDTG